MLIFNFSRHGLGDTYNKIFCDPKLPFADCARKWYPNKNGGKNESQKGSSDEDEESASETRTSLRRSARTTVTCERDDDDTDALSELETLARLGRADEPPGTERWFSERALETRLHHIAHAVQNREWPAPAPSAAPIASAADERKQAQKRHIAIDVETDRAKLHALLSSPAAAHSGVGTGAGASHAAEVEGGPPPAHQRQAAAPASAATAVDLSAPLDLSEPSDFSVGRRTPHVDTPASAGTSSRSKLDDTLSKLMKRKNAVSFS